MQQLPTVKIKSTRHRDGNQLFIHFEYNKVLIAKTKSLLNAKWSKTHSAWYIENRPENLKQIFLVFNSIAIVDVSALPFKNKKEKVTKKQIAKKAYPKKQAIVPEEFLLFMKRKRYSENTIKIYTSFLKAFMEFIEPKTLASVSINEIKRYQDYLVNKKKVAISTQNQSINALKCYYENIVGWDRFSVSINRPRKEKQLPKIISEIEVLKMIQVCDNIKHKLIISLLYASGLRMSELLNLRKQDILTEKSTIFVRGGKGKKDRTSLLAEHLKPLLSQYLDQYKPNYWLFEGYNRTKYSSSSVSKLIKTMSKKARIRQNVSAHMLRHSFATHI
jgi:site-specific recombinase XerD